MVSEVAIFITPSSNSKRHFALKGTKSRETVLLQWHRYPVGTDPVAQMLTNTDFGSSCNPYINMKLKAFFFCLKLLSICSLALCCSKDCVNVSLQLPFDGVGDCLRTFLWTAVWHRASVHEYFGSDVAAFFMGALVVLLCAFEVQLFFSPFLSFSETSWFSSSFSQIKLLAESHNIKSGWRLLLFSFKSGPDHFGRTLHWQHESNLYCKYLDFISIICR